MEQRVVPPWDSGLIDSLRDLYPGLRGFAASVSGREVQPDDLVQEAITRLLARDPQPVIENLNAYLRKSIFHLAVDGTRRRQRFDVVAPKIATSEAQSDNYPSDIDALFALKPGVRALLYSHLVEGTPIVDAAVALGMSNSAARVAVHRAKKVLRTHLEGSVDHD